MTIGNGHVTQGVCALHDYTHVGLTQFHMYVMGSCIHVVGSEQVVCTGIWVFHLIDNVSKL